MDRQTDSPPVPFGFVSHYSFVFVLHVQFCKAKSRCTLSQVVHQQHSVTVSYHSLLQYSPPRLLSYTHLSFPWLLSSSLLPLSLFSFPHFVSFLVIICSSLSFPFLYLFHLLVISFLISSLLFSSPFLFPCVLFFPFLFSPVSSPLLLWTSVTLNVFTAGKVKCIYDSDKE